jgi:hypothetical protein
LTLASLSGMIALLEGPGNISCGGFVLRLKLRCGCALVVVALPLLGGCGGGKEYSAPLPEENVQLRQLAVFFGQYQSRNKGQMPRNEQELKSFIQSTGVTDVDSVLVSKRDGQPFVVRYGKAGGVGGPPQPGKSPSEPVVAYEKTGVDGKRMVAFSTGRVELVDETRFQELVKP